MNHISIRLQVGNTEGGVNIYALTNLRPTKVTNGDSRIIMNADCSKVESVQQFIQTVSSWENIKIESEERLLINSVMSCDRLNNVSVIYFKKILNTYVNNEDGFEVTTNDENTVLFNTPVNLLFAATLTNEIDLTFISDHSKNSAHEVIVRMIRNNTSVSVYPDVNTMFGAYSCNLVTDTITANEMSVRSLQYNHLMRLINNQKFKSNINNGNLLLAYADIYRSNVDADTLDIPNPCQGIDSIEYDQFTGSVSDNVIQVYTNHNNSLYDNYYASDELNNSFVELLVNCIKHWFDQNSKHEGPM